MIIRNRSNIDFHFYLNFTIDLLNHVKSYSNPEYSHILDKITLELENCNKIGSIDSFKKVLLHKLPCLAALIEEDGILDAIDQTVEDKSYDILKLKSIIGFICWKTIA